MITAKITGLPDFRAALKAVPEKLRKRALRNALAVAGRVVRDEARRNAPVLQASAKDAPFRKPGTVRRAISVRTSKQDRRAGNVGVFINVRPAKRGQRGAKNPNDPFYWRFLEFGTVKYKTGQGDGFLQKAAKRLPDALEAFKRALQPAIDKINRKLTP
jgi:HK97 gp10 family phage protein